MQKIRRYVLLVATMALLILGATACEPPGPPATTPGLQAEVIYNGTHQFGVNINPDINPVSSQVVVDDEPSGPSQTALNYTFNWDTAAEVDGPHVIRVAVTTGNNVVKTSPTLVYTRNHSTSSSVLVVGASNSAMAFAPPDNDKPWEGAPANTRVVAGPGWLATAPQIQQAIVSETAGGLKVAVLDIGANEASLGTSNPGWTAHDDAGVRSTVDAFADDACLVFVRQGYTPNLSQAWREQIDTANAAIDTIASERSGPVIFVEWQEWINAHQQLMDPDGIHGTQAAYAALRNLMWTAAAECPMPALGA